MKGFKCVSWTAIVAILLSTLPMVAGDCGPDGCQTELPSTQSPVKPPYTQTPTKPPYTESPTKPPYSESPTKPPYRPTESPTKPPYTESPVMPPYTQSPVKPPYTQSPIAASYPAYAGPAHLLPHHGGLDLLHLNLGLNLLHHARAHGRSSQHTQFTTIFNKAAPLLAAKNVGQSLTIFMFDDVTDAHQVAALNAKTSDAAGCLAFIQEHTVGPAMTVHQLIQRGTVTNMNGRSIVVVSSDHGHTVRTNGKLIVEREINLQGAHIIGHRLEAPLTFARPSSSTADLVPGCLGGLLGHVGVLLHYVLAIVAGLLGTLLAGLGLSHDSPLTFIAPGPAEITTLKATFQRYGPLFAKPAFEKVLLTSLYPGAISPLELQNAHELKNLAGEAKTIAKRNEDTVKLDKDIVNTGSVVPTSNGFIFSETTADKAQSSEESDEDTRRKRSTGHEAAAASLLNQVETVSTSGLALDNAGAVAAPVASSTSSAVGAMPVDVPNTVSGIQL